MRDLEQAKAEVFRRSNARIKKRKAIRRSLIACCVPLVLCVGVFSVTILPAMMPASAQDSAESNMMPMDVYNGSGMTFESSLSDSWPLFSSTSTKGDGTAQRGSSANILIHGEVHPLPKEDAQVILDILEHLQYNPYRVCRCMPRFELETESESYGLHLGEGYARCDRGQAPLTEKQIQAIREILSRNKIQIK